MDVAQLASSDTHHVEIHAPSHLEEIDVVTGVLRTSAFNERWKWLLEQLLYHQLIKMRIASPYARGIQYRMWQWLLHGFLVCGWAA